MRNPRKGPFKLMLRLLPLAILLSLHPEAQCAPRTVSARERLAAMYGYPPGWNKPPDKAERSSYNGNLSPGYGIGADSSANTYDNANNAKSPEYDAAPKAIHPEKTSSIVNGDSGHGNRVQPASSDQVEPGKSSEFARVQSGKANTAVQVRGRRHMETSDEPIDYQELDTSTTENVGEDEETRRLATMEYRTLEEAVEAEREMTEKAANATQLKAEYTERLPGLTGEVDELNEELERLKTEGQQTREEIGRHEENINNDKDRKTSLEDESSLRGKVSEATAAFNEATEKLSKAKSEIARLQNKLNADQTKAEKLLSDVGLLERDRKEKKKHTIVCGDPAFQRQMNWNEQKGKGRSYT